MNRYFAGMSTSQTQRTVKIAIGVVVLNGLLYLTPVYRVVGPGAVLWINNLTSIGAALLSVGLAFRLWRSSNRGESLRLIWTCVLSGLILWTIAEIIWDSYQLFLGIKLPSASAADVAWILGYIALIFGLILRIRTFRMRPTKTWQFIILAAFGVLSVLVVVYNIIPSLNETPTGVYYEKFIDVFYPICDLLLAFLAVLLVLVLEGGLLSKPWTAVAAACFCIAVSDLLYAFAVSHGIYQVDPAAGLDFLSYVIDISYTVAYVLMAFGLYQQARLQDAF